MTTIDGAPSRSLPGRMLRAALLEPDVYEDVEADRTSAGTGEALAAVAIVALCTGAGAALRFLPAGHAGRAAVSLAAQVVAGLVGWVVWSSLTYVVGTRLFAGRSTPGEVVRTLGFAHAPGVLNVLAFLPVLGAAVPHFTQVWMLVAGIVAARQALDLDTGRATLAALAGWLVIVVVSTFLDGLLGLGGLVRAL